MGTSSNGGAVSADNDIPGAMQSASCGDRPAPHRANRVQLVWARLHCCDRHPGRRTTRGHIGVETPIFGVDDLEVCTVWMIRAPCKVLIRRRKRFERSGSESSSCEAMIHAAPTAAIGQMASGNTRAHLGVDSPRHWRIWRRLSTRPRSAAELTDGTFRADDGSRRLGSGKKRPVVSIPDRVNSPGRIERPNQQQAMATRAPDRKTINSRVFFRGRRS